LPKKDGFKGYEASLIVSIFDSVKFKSLEEYNKMAISSFDFDKDYSVLENNSSKLDGQPAYKLIYEKDGKKSTQIQVLKDDGTVFELTYSIDNLLYNQDIQKIVNSFEMT